MKHTIISLLFAATICILQASFSFAQTLKADYQFQGDLNSLVAGAPALTNLVGAGNGPNTFITNSVDGFDRTVLNFSMNNGVAINSLSGVVPDNSFTVALLFKFGAQSGRRRLFDHSGGTAADEGVFLVGGRIEGEDASIPGNTVNTYVQVVIVRGNGFIRVYREGVLRVTSTDPGGPLPSGLRWFQDYVNNPIQAAPGAIARMRFYDAPMTAQQIHQLDRIPEAPAGPTPIATYSNLFGQTEMFRMNTDGTSQRRLSNTEAIEFGARFSPDGQMIVYHRRETPTGIRQIWIANSDGSNPVQLTNTATNNHNPSWHPNGQKILYSKCDASFICDIATMDPNGSNQASIPGSINTAVDEDQPRFTPDGNKIVFVCISDVGNYNLCTSNADGSNRAQITATGVAIHNLTPDISPNGTRIIFIRGTNAGNNRTYTANIDGTGVLAMPQTQAPATPLWSPDGTKIAYSSTVSNSNEIFIANADGFSAVQITFNSVDDRLSDWYRPQTVIRRTLFDFDGDGKTDPSVYRPSAGDWYLLNTTTGFRALHFGLPSDIMVPADYTGDGKTDMAVWRPSDSIWYVLRSEDNTFYGAAFGASGDIPAPGDHDGDGKADLVVIRPGATQSFWYLQQSTAGFAVVPFGLAGDVPTLGDYDGDGKNDVAVYRPSAGAWFRFSSSNGSFLGVGFGISGDKVVPADYTGDGKTDLAVFRPSNNIWYILRSEDNSLTGGAFGAAGDLPSPGDYDGDGKADLAVYRPGPQSVFYLLQSTAGFNAIPWGLAEDRPVPNAYVY